MKITKKILSMILALVLVLGLLPATAFAADSPNLMSLEELREVKGAFAVEAYNLGQGFLVEPSLYIPKWCSKPISAAYSICANVPPNS